MSNFTCQDMGKLQIKTKLPKSKTATSSKSIQRFLKAHSEGVKFGSILVKYGKNYNMNRSGVKFEVVLKELQNKKIKQKSKDYIWYIFPQPVFDRPHISTTSRYFFIDEEEVELFLKNTTLRNNLNSALHALERKKLNDVQLTKYFSSNGDNNKFASFRRFFLNVIRKIEKKSGLSPTTDTGIQSIKKKLLILKVNT